MLDHNTSKPIARPSKGSIQRDVGDPDDHGADDDGDVGERIAEVVDQDAAQIEVAAAAHQRQRDAAVDGERRDRSPDHPALDDLDGSA